MQAWNTTPRPVSTTPGFASTTRRRAAGGAQQPDDPSERTLKDGTKQEQYRKCLESHANVLRVADNVGFFGLASALLNLGSSLALAGYEKIQERTATELGKAIAKQIPNPTADGILDGIQEAALFRQGNVATLGRLSLWASVRATAPSVVCGIKARLCMALQVLVGARTMNEFSRVWLLLAVSYERQPPLNAALYHWTGMALVFEPYHWLVLSPLQF